MYSAYLISRYTTFLGAHMKLLTLCLFLLASNLSFAQGLLFESDRDKVLEGPTVFKLGIDSNNNLIQISNERPLFSMPITGKTSFQKDVLKNLSSTDRTQYKQTIMCTGKTEVLNGVLIVNKARVCIQIFDGRLLYCDLSLSPNEVLKERQLIDQMLWGYIDESFIKNHVNNSERGSIKENQGGGSNQNQLNGSQVSHQ